MGDLPGIATAENNTPRSQITKELCREQGQSGE